MMPLLPLISLIGTLMMQMTGPHCTLFSSSRDEREAAIRHSFLFSFFFFGLKNVLINLAHNDSWIAPVHGNRNVPVHGFIFLLTKKIWTFSLQLLEGTNIYIIVSC